MVSSSELGGTVAAGIAGGEMLLRGISEPFGLLHLAFFGGGQVFLVRVEEVVVNNYGDSNRDGFSDGDRGAG